jgi:hypothetical protein
MGNAVIARDGRHATGAGGSRSELSRDSRFGQRNCHALLVEVVNCSVDGLVEVYDIGEGLMGEKMRLEVAPDGFDVVEFGSVLE